jgi:ribosome-binding factor A
MISESIRQKKLADQIKKQVSLIIDRKLKDPRKGFITLTGVKLSRDLRIASIYYTILGDEEQHRKSQQVLESGKNFIRSELAPNIKLRYTPELRFFYDDSLEYSEHIENLLKKIHSQDMDKRK